MGAENLAPTGIGSLERPAHAELLHQLCYPGPYQDIRDSNFNMTSTAVIMTHHVQSIKYF